LTNRPARTPRLALVLSSLLVAGALLPILAAPVAAATGSRELISAANAERSKAGLAPVASHSTLNVIAAERALQQAADENLSHDFDYVMARFDQENVCWQGFGEILAWNGSGAAGDFIEQWMNSTPHRQIMLGSSYTVAGGAWARGADGHWYAAMLFMTPCAGSTVPTGSTSFTDTTTSPFAADIEWLVDARITTGCTATRFCPNAAVTRGQMASFLVRALELPSTGRDFFRDDESSAHEADINRLAASGIASGCAPGRYCPSATVTRAEMASFLTRGLSLARASRDYFYDDERSIHEPSINRVAQAAITGGCASARYCPASSVTRGQMAAFLRRAFS
jgi:hypothetical protein